MVVAAHADKVLQQFLLLVTGRLVTGDWERIFQSLVTSH